MGMWGFKPWDNDQAADWFGNFMDKTKFRKAWLSGIKEDPTDEPDVVRAAAALFVRLGHVYVWPIDMYAEDLERTIVALEAVANCSDYLETPELLEAIASEISELKSRQ